MPKSPKQPPMVDYTMKLMLLEAIKCRNDEDINGLVWIQRQLFTMANRYRELEQRRPKLK